MGGLKRLSDYWCGRPCEFDRSGEGSWEGF